MSNLNNVEQFNAQVKQMSDRLRGESASPADIQGSEGTLEDRTNPPEVSTPAAASPLSHQPSRKKGTGGKRGAALPKQSGPVTTTPGETEANPTLLTAQADAPTARERGDQPDAIQPSVETDRDGDVPSQRETTQATAENEATPPDLIAPEVIGRTPSGEDTRKPLSYDSPAQSDAAPCDAIVIYTTKFVMPPSRE